MSGGLKLFQVFDDGPAILRRKSGTNHPIPFRPVLKLVTMIAITGPADIVTVAPLEFGSIVTNFDRIEPLASSAECIGSLVLRREQRI